MEYIKLSISVWLFFVAFYCLYIMAINVYYYRTQVSKTVIIMTFPALFMMISFDIFFNLTIANVIFADMAQELTLSERLTRYRTNPAYANTWRYRISTYICTRLLNPFDPTRNHC